LKKVILQVFLTVIATYSQNINIRGIVTDTSGKTPVKGVVVTLEKYGFTDTTAEDGSFVLTGMVNIRSNTSQLQPDFYSANIHDGKLSLHLPERSKVSIITYTVQGKVVSKVQKVLDTGTHCVTQSSLGHGLYIYMVRVGDKSFIIEGTDFGSGQVASAISGRVKANVNSASRIEVTNDVLFASKPGLLNYAAEITNFDTSGIIIMMIPGAENISDAEGNIYQCVRLGSQIWTVENWRCKKYNDGNDIPHVSDNEQWKVLSTPAYCFYDNSTNPGYQKKWGALYNWYVVDTINPKKIAPKGWRVPTSSDWYTLEKYLTENGYNWDGTTMGNKIAKSIASRTDWSLHSDEGAIGNDLLKNNASGFSALPGGGRTNFGNFDGQGDLGSWWSTNEFSQSSAWDRYIYNFSNEFSNFNGPKTIGRSIRLVRDN
jgi:uncharacterized protein (TIGR02145 family)